MPIRYLSHDAYQSEGADLIGGVGNLFQIPAKMKQLQMDNELKAAQVREANMRNNLLNMQVGSFESDRAFDRQRLASQDSRQSSLDLFNRNLEQSKELRANEEHASNQAFKRSEGISKGFIQPKHTLETMPDGIQGPPNMFVAPEDAPAYNLFAQNSADKARRLDISDTFAKTAQANADISTRKLDQIKTNEMINAEKMAVSEEKATVIERVRDANPEFSFMDGAIQESLILAELNRDPNFKSRVRARVAELTGSKHSDLSSLTGGEDVPQPVLKEDESFDGLAKLLMQQPAK